MSFAYLPLFTGDYLRDTRGLSPLRHGVYLLALVYCWDSKGPMPLDEQECAGICNCRSGDEVEALRFVLGRFFVRMDDGHYNKRIAEEVAKSERLSATLSEAGLKGVEAKRAKARAGARAKANATLKGRSVSPSPSPSPSLTLSSSSNSDAPLRGLSSGKAPRKRVSKPVPSVSVWDSYRTAYADKYGVDPVRNAKVNSQLAQLVSRLGEEEAAGVAAFYLSNRNGLYVSAKHCTDLLLRDAEKLRTEWVTGNVTHRRDASEEDRLSATGAMWDRVGEKLKERGIE